MRVIAGSARSIPLATPKGMQTRPTQDRVKETLFNILQNELNGAYFLDLFAGSGQMGIEALSRGAREAYFIDQNKDAISCIRSNLEKTRLAQQGHIISSDVSSALSLWNRNDRIDLVFLDPPYGQELEISALRLLHPLLHENSLVILECALKEDLSFLQGLSYCIERIKEYKSNQHIFLRLG